jgi:hypothetical protein
MAATEIRAKEANAQLTVDGRRLGGSFSTIKDLSIKPDKEIAKKRFPGMKRAVGDLDIKGYDFSFKTEKRDHAWRTVWGLFEQADKNGTVFPVVTIAITYSYRDGSSDVRTNTLHGDLILALDDTNLPESGYLMDSWTGFGSFFT